MSAAASHERLGEEGSEKPSSGMKSGELARASNPSSDASRANEYVIGLPVMPMATITPAAVLATGNVHYEQRLSTSLLACNRFLWGVALMQPTSCIFALVGAPLMAGISILMSIIYGLFLREHMLGGKARDLTRLGTARTMFIILMVMILPFLFVYAQLAEQTHLGYLLLYPIPFGLAIVISAIMIVEDGTTLAHMIQIYGIPPSQP
jgi:ABC-type Na+ efflux pump permease subunit